MSWHECPQAESRPALAPTDPVELMLVPRSRDIGGFEVGRVLPAGRRRMVGPFVFFDQMGPSILRTGTGLDVRPHPHIGLATVTYLFRGELLHRDSLGSVQTIRPGELNWMTAGAGIVHSERTPPGLRDVEKPLFGIQAWVALPREAEETEPVFAHFAADALPIAESDGIRVRLIAGELFGLRAPAPTLSETIYADIELAARAVLPVERTHVERALFLVSGELEIAGRTHAPGRLLVLAPGTSVAVVARSSARLMLLGGAPLDGPRHLWWNFVSSRQERIEQAKADWQAGRFPAVPGERDSIPLPDTPGS